MARNPLSIRHRPMLRTGVCFGVACTAWVCSGQIVTSPDAPASVPADPWMEHLLPDADDPGFKAYAQQQKLRKAKALELRRFRATYFGAGSSTETRQVGLVLLGERYNDPALYPLLLETFERDSVETKAGLLGVFAGARTDEADATIAWVAVHDDKAEVREMALAVLADRVGAVGGVSDRIRHVVAGGLREKASTPAIAAAGIAENLRLYEMVPLMIAAQVGGNTGGAGEGRSNLGWIVIGQQTAFVSDLQPVVSDSAVGFDPTLSVITEGVVLEVQDASVITYRTEIFYSLTRMTSEALGRPTGSLGMDEKKWWAWYESDWKPWMEAQALEQTRQEAEESEAEEVNG